MIIYSSSIQAGEYSRFKKERSRSLGQDGRWWCVTEAGCVAPGVCLAMALNPNNDKHATTGRALYHLSIKPRQRLKFVDDAHLR